MVTHDAKAATRGSRLVTMRDGVVVGDVQNG
jgi:predicted ABC-type transport system involved in lysophospholipase L1 biosynthesis ATPase subunit